jgi:hypothetical protein
MSAKNSDFGFVGGEYTASDFRQDAQKCVNWDPEISKNQGTKTVIALLGCPGLVLVAQVGPPSVPPGGVPPGGVPPYLVTEGGVPLLQESGKGIAL